MTPLATYACDLQTALVPGARSNDENCRKEHDKRGIPRKHEAIPQCAANMKDEDIGIFEQIYYFSCRRGPALIVGLNGCLSSALFDGLLASGAWTK